MTVTVKTLVAPLQMQATQTTQYTATRDNTEMVIEDWMLGPENPSNERGANKPYWVALAKAMQVDEAEARRRRCSNCEYYDNSPDMQIKMERIPVNAWDKDAGYRGYCMKFDFICHDMRSCQAWEEYETA
ncbi:MAG: hypothetical protein EB117_18640 [Betaproteobacteria bacterium]|nr:hypothetical protein [Betaproteobacteria bacterium]